MSKIYTDLNGEVLSNGDEIITIRLNGKAVGGSLTKAFFKIDEKGKGMIVSNMNDTYPSFYFYKQNFDEKVMKIKK